MTVPAGSRIGVFNPFQLAVERGLSASGEGPGEDSPAHDIGGTVPDPSTAIFLMTR